MDESVQAICTDVQACRNLRAQMFDRELNKQSQSSGGTSAPFSGRGKTGASGQSITSKKVAQQ